MKPNSETLSKSWKWNENWKVRATKGWNVDLKARHSHIRRGQPLVYVTSCKNDKQLIYIIVMSKKVGVREVVQMLITAHLYCESSPSTIKSDFDFLICFFFFCPDVPSRKNVLEDCWLAPGSPWVRAPSSVLPSPWHPRRSASPPTSR